MPRVVARGVVALGPEALDERVGGPALEGEGAGFEALRQAGAGEQGFVGVADGGVVRFGAGVEDG